MTGTETVAARSKDSTLDPKKVRKAVQQAIEDEFAVTAWKPKKNVKFVIDCPSGQRCLAKHLNTMDLIESNLIEELDFFTKQLFPANFDEQGNPVERSNEDNGDSIWGVLRSPEKKVRFFNLLNRLLEIAILKPKIFNDGVAIVNNEDGEPVVKVGTNKRPLKEGEVPASAVDFSDKMVIFSELNKPLDAIKPFREQQNAVLASMEPSKVVGS